MKFAACVFVALSARAMAQAPSRSTNLKKKAKVDTAPISLDGSQFTKDSRSPEQRQADLARVDSEQASRVQSARAWAAHDTEVEKVKREQAEAKQKHEEELAIKKRQVEAQERAAAAAEKNAAAQSSVAETLKEANQRK